MPQQAEAKFLYHLTAVPAGWPLATVIDAFADLAIWDPNNYYADATRAREALSRRLVDLWASQPAEAQAWRELHAKEATRPEELQEALLRHGAAEFGKYGWGGFSFTEAEVVRGEPRGSAAERERWAAWYLQQPVARDRCWELAERLVQAESPETAQKRQKLEQEAAERRRLEAELHKSQEEGRELRNRLAAAEAEVSSKTAELQAAQSESAKCKERCEELATRAAAAESAVADMRQELGQLQEEHGTCQQRREELAARLQAEASQHARTEERLSRAEADAAERQVEVERLQEESRGCLERCQQAEARLAEAGSQAEKSVLQQLLAKAEAERSAMFGQLLDLREERGMHKERIRELEQQLCEAKKLQASHHSNSQDGRHSIAASGAASSEREPDPAELLGYSFVDEDGASILSGSSQSSVNQNCFMLDSMFKVRLDVFRKGRDLHKGSQVVAADGKTVLEVVEIKEAQATEVVDLHVGTDVLRVTPDHRVQVPDAGGKLDETLYRPAGQLEEGHSLILDSGEAAKLTAVHLKEMDCKVLKIVFQPDLPVPVFSGPTCILSKGHEKKSRGVRRGGMCQRGREASDPTDGAFDPMEGASIPDTAAGEYTD